MVKRNFIEKLTWSIVLTVAILVIFVFAMVNNNFGIIHAILMLLLGAFDAYFIYSTVRLFKYLNYEKIAKEKNMIVTATFLDKKTAYKLGNFKTDLVEPIFKVQFSWVNELGEMIIDESLAIFSKREVEELANRGSFAVFVAHEKKAVIFFDRI